MSTTPIPAPPLVDAAQNVGSSRTLGTGHQQAAAGDDPRLDTGGGVYVIANTFAGADIGAQINTAVAAAVTTGIKEIRVLDGDYILATRVILEDGITLKLGVGTISNSLVEDRAPIIQMKDNCSVIGSGWGTVLMPNVTTANFNVVIADFLSQRLSPIGISLPGNENLVVRDLKVIRNPSSTTPGTQSSIISFGNTKNVLVENCYLLDSEGYGVANASDSSLGYHGDYLTVQNCVFDNVATQNLVAVNCDNVRFLDNVFLNGSTPGPSLIDLEMNGPTDSMRNFIIRGNLFSLTGGVIISGCISVIGDLSSARFATLGRPCFGIIADNVLDCGDEGTSSYAYQGIALSAAHNVLVNNNVITYPVNAGIGFGGCENCTMDNNKVVGGNSFSGISYVVAESLGCTVSNNVAQDYSGAAASSRPSIVETGTSDYNLIINNRLAFSPYNAAGPSTGYDTQVVLVGANSRVANTIQGSKPLPTDAALLQSIAELQLLPIPGARNAAAPAVVLLGGYAVQGDGGFSVWIYDAASTATANAVTVVQPTYQSGAGRWLRASSRIRLNTTDRDALSLTSDDAGFDIFNTTSGVNETWNGTAWVSGGGGSSGFTVTAVKTSAYTASIDETVRVDASGGAFVITLPTAAGQSGKAIEIKNVTNSTNAVTVTPAGSETIDTASTLVLASAFGSFTLRSDGSDWMVV